MGLSHDILSCDTVRTIELHINPRRNRLNICCRITRKTSRALHSQQQQKTTKQWRPQRINLSLSYPGTTVSSLTAGRLMKRPQLPASVALYNWHSYVCHRNRLPSCFRLTSIFQPTQGPGLVDAFVCNCTDCHKLTASVFASNFTVDDAYLKHLRGRDNLKTWSQSTTIASGNTMTNYFCNTCGTLLYRVSSGFPGNSILRIGTIDDFRLMETKIKPTIEQFIGTRVAWRSGVEGAKEFEGDHFAA